MCIVYTKYIILDGVFTVRSDNLMITVIKMYVNSYDAFYKGGKKRCMKNYFPPLRSRV